MEKQQEMEPISGGSSSGQKMVDVENMDLERFRLCDLPDSIYYVPDFVSVAKERYLLQKVYESPKPKWTQLSNRRLQNWGGYPHPKGMIVENLPTWLQKYASKIGQLKTTSGAENNSVTIFPKTPNHVLINEYLAGQGIMPHVDGPVFHPVISTLSLGSHAVLDFYHTTADASVAPSIMTATEVDQPDSKANTGLESRHAFSLLLQPRSLLISTGKIYTGYLHGIKAVRKDLLDSKIANLDACSGLTEGQIVERSTRVSLTIRLVQKTSKGFRLR